MTSNALKAQVQEAIKEEIKGSAVKTMRGILKAVEERKAWVETRQGQINELGTMADKLGEAYDKADERTVEEVRQALHELTGRGCKAKRRSNDLIFDED